MLRAVFRPNLTGVLALAALADLVLLRLAAEVFLPSHSGGASARTLEQIGLFMSNLGGVIGLVVIASVLGRALRGDTIFPRSMRITVSTIGLFFLLISTMGVVAVSVPDRFLAYMRISHAFLATFIAVGLWHKEVTTRLRVAVTLAALPMVLLAAAGFLDRLGWQPMLVSIAARLAQLLALAVLASSPWLVPPQVWDGRRKLVGWGAGLVALGLAGWAVATRYDVIQIVALYGFRLDLPAAVGIGGLLYAVLVALAISGVAATVSVCLLGSGVARLFGYGLVLLAAAGHVVVTTNHALFSLCGLCSLAVGALLVGRQQSAVEEPAVSDAHAAE